MSRRKKYNEKKTGKETEKRLNSMINITRKDGKTPKNEPRSIQRISEEEEKNKKKQNIQEIDTGVCLMERNKKLRENGKKRYYSMSQEDKQKLKECIKEYMK